VVAALLAGGALAWLVVARDGGSGSVSSGIDWSSPGELPPTAREDFRSEFVSDEEGYRFWPRSGRITPSLAYRFDTGHCGLGFLTDFDGSFWRPADSAPTRLLINQDLGAIALIGFDAAVYRSSDGREIMLERLPGPVVTQPCE
jgi:hypothetical protein